MWNVRSLTGGWPSYCASGNDLPVCADDDDLSLQGDPSDLAYLPESALHLRFENVAGSGFVRMACTLQDVESPAPRQTSSAEAASVRLRLAFPIAFSSEKMFHPVWRLRVRLVECSVYGPSVGSTPLVASTGQPTLDQSMKGCMTYGGYWG